LIVQDSDGGLLLVKQTDHALLSGAFAAAWGNDIVPAPRRRESTLIAAARHDDGWSEWELAPRIGDDGRPIDFIRVPIDEHVALYRRGIDLVEAEDPYAGLVVSLHGERLYTRPFYPGMQPRIANLTDERLRLAQAYVEHERQRQSRLTGADADASSCAEEAWRLLQVWDRLSLLVCMEPVAKARGEMPPISIGDEDVRIAATGTDAEELLLDPYPFGSEPASFGLAAIRTVASSWDDDRGFRIDYRTAAPTVISFSCRRA
jgi:hypothetical protein